MVKLAEGSKQWWSGQGDDLKNTLSRTVDLTGKSKASLDLSGWWDIEANYDFLYAEVSTDGGANYTPLDGTADGKPITRDGSDKPALTGTSGAYKKLAYSLDAYAGKKIDLRFRYATDGGTSGKGFTADAISLTADGQTLFTDNAEGDDNGWTSKGFSRIGASFTKEYPQYYIAENRQYVSYDQTLKAQPVQLRLEDGEAHLGRALPLPDRPADLAVGHLAARQQRRRAPGQRPHPADRRPPQAREVGRRHPDAQPLPGLRLALQLVPGAGLHRPLRRRGRPRQGQARRPGLRRPQEHLLRRVQPHGRRQDQRHQHPDQDPLAGPPGGSTMTVQVGPSTK
ncbi:hypothetical protein GCM10020000_50650 [Streptomyces olivoverticillatus]